MGQLIISSPIPSSPQRIQPTPGLSGHRNKKGTISVYCESSCTIFSLSRLPGITVKDLKKMTQIEKCDLMLNGLVLQDDQMIESLDLEASTLIKIVTNNNFCKSSSTLDTLQDLHQKTTFGPCSKRLEKLEKPSSDSFSQTILNPEKEINFLLKSFSVPDVKLVISSQKKNPK
jgi:hypothetical protein